MVSENMRDGIIQKNNYCETLIKNNIENFESKIFTID